MADINLELYKVFYEAATCKSLSKAAVRLFVSQSAVSQAILQLEQKLNGRLFDRGARGVTLTPEGEVLYTHVKSALSTIENAQQRLLDLRQLNEGRIKIGASDTICSLFLLPYLKLYNEAYPGIHISVINRVTKASLELLKHGDAELSFVNLPVEDDPMLDIIPIMPVHDCFAVGDKYAFLVESQLDYTALCEYPVLMLEKASNTRNWIDSFLAQHHVSIRPAIELGSLSLLASFAKIGLGIAATIREDIADMLERGELYELRFTQPLPLHHIGLAKLRNVTLPIAAQRFVDGLGIHTPAAETTK